MLHAVQQELRNSNRPIRRSEIALMLGVRRSTVGRALHRLSMLGKAKKLESDEWIDSSNTNSRFDASTEQSNKLPSFLLSYWDLKPKERQVLIDNGAALSIGDVYAFISSNRRWLMRNRTFQYKVLVRHFGTKLRLNRLSQAYNDWQAALGSAQNPQNAMPHLNWLLKKPESAKDARWLTDSADSILRLPNTKNRNGTPVTIRFTGIASRLKKLGVTLWIGSASVESIVFVANLTPSRVRMLRGALSRLLMQNSEISLDTDLPLQIDESVAFLPLKSLAAYDNSTSFRNLLSAADRSGVLNVAGLQLLAEVIFQELDDFEREFWIEVRTILLSTS
jgi:hypothetical protein